jgi:hypothetical protein
MANVCSNLSTCLDLAQKGDVRSQFELAVIYDLGKDIASNPKEAFKWYKIAAENGNVNAQFKIGEYYKLGEVVNRDYVEAAKWYSKAANNGHHSAKVMLWQLEKLGHIQSQLTNGNSAGTGFYILKDIVATSLHVVRGCDSIELSDQSSNNIAEVIAEDNFNDIALLKAANGAKSYLKMSDEPLKQWEEVIEVGFDGSKLVNAQTKIVHPSLELKERIKKETRVIKRIKLVGVAKPGFSGGPIINSSGDVIGIMSSGARLSGTSNTNKVAYDLVTHIKYIIELLKRHNINANMDSKIKSTNNMKDAVVKINCINH